MQGDRFNPKLFYAAVGTAFPLYRNVMQAGAEGVLGMGSWNAEASPGAKPTSTPTSRIRRARSPTVGPAAPPGPALEILTPAVGKVGLDRKAIRDYIASTEHQTIIGPIRFEGSENVGSGEVGQWQNGEFEVVWPKSIATAPLMPAKPAWVLSGSAGGMSPRLVRADRVRPDHRRLYALVALGLNLQYGLMRILNIAHGEFLVLGAFLTWSAHTTLAFRRCGCCRCRSCC